MRTDVQLLSEWVVGDLDAGNELFDRHFNSLYRFFRSKVHHDDAVEELVQATFLACVEGRDRFRGDASFRTYLFAIARRRLYSWFRARHPEREQNLSESSLFDLEVSPSGLAAEKQEQRILLEALRRVPLDHQIAVELYYWEDLDGSELAEVLDVPVGTVRSRLRRARQLLEAELKAVSTSDEVLASTLTNLDAWAVSIRERFERAS